MTRLNSAFGFIALMNNQNGSNNTSVGYRVLSGNDALSYNCIAQFNTAVRANALTQKWFCPNYPSHRSEE